MNKFKVGDRVILKDLDCIATISGVNIPKPYPQEGFCMQVEFFDSKLNCFRYMQIEEISVIDKVL